MIGRTLRQALSPPLALVFLLGLLAGAYGYHGCPHHGKSGHGAPGSAANRAAGQLPADHAGTPVVHRTDGQDGGDEGSPFCICVGSCHAGAATAHPGPATVELLGPALGPDPVSGTAGQVPPHRTPAYFLPYSLGPPAA